MNLRFSLLTLLGITAYVASCCPMFVYWNLWWGTLVVVSTIVILIVGTIRIATTSSWFWLGFSVAGWSWLVLVLGLQSQTVVDSSIGEHVVIWLNSRHRSIVRCWESSSSEPEFRTYSLFSQPPGPLIAVGLPSGKNIMCVPLYENFVRLVACLSALLFGLLGGLLFHLFQRRTAPETLP